MTHTDGQLKQVKSMLKEKVLETKKELADLRKTLSKPKVIGTVSWKCRSIANGRSD